MPCDDGTWPVLVQICGNFEKKKKKKKTPLFGIVHRLPDFTFASAICIIQKMSNLLSIISIRSIGKHFLFYSIYDVSPVYVAAMKCARILNEVH